jgi:VCBS repeat-containing protein
MRKKAKQESSFEIDEALWKWALCMGNMVARDHDELNEVFGAVLALAVFERQGLATAHVDHNGQYHWTPTKAFFRSTGLKAGKTISVAFKGDTKGGQS